MKRLFHDERLTLCAIVGAMACALGAGLIKGQVDWGAVAGAGLLVLGGLMQSPIKRSVSADPTPPAETPDTDT